MKRILKIAGIWYLTSVICGLGYCIYDAVVSNMFLSGVIEWLKGIFFFPLVTPFLAVLIFLPAIFILYLLFKKIKNYIVRMVMTAFMIPFNNFVYFQLADKFNFHNSLEEFVVLIGIYALYAVLPVSFIASLIIPRVLLPIKRYVMGSIVLMFIFGWILAIFCIAQIVNNID